MATTNALYEIEGHLSSPAIQVLMQAKTRGVFLRILLDGPPDSLKDLARDCSLTTLGASNALNALTFAGLVRSEFVRRRRIVHATPEALVESLRKLANMLEAAGQETPAKLAKVKLAAEAAALKTLDLATIEARYQELLGKPAPKRPKVIDMSYRRQLIERLSAALMERSAS